MRCHEGSAAAQRAHRDDVASSCRRGGSCSVRCDAAGAGAAAVTGGGGSGGGAAVVAEAAGDIVAGGRGCTTQFSNIPRKINSLRVNDRGLRVQGLECRIKGIGYRRFRV